jgi:hypothetical protein
VFSALRDTDSCKKGLRCQALLTSRIGDTRRAFPHRRNGGSRLLFPVPRLRNTRENTNPSFHFRGSRKPRALMTVRLAGDGGGWKCGYVLATRGGAPTFRYSPSTFQPLIGKCRFPHGFATGSNLSFKRSFPKTKFRRDDFLGDPRCQRHHWKPYRNEVPKVSNVYHDVAAECQHDRQLEYDAAT